MRPPSPYYGGVKKAFEERMKKEGRFAVTLAILYAAALFIVIAIIL